MRLFDHSKRQVEPTPEGADLEVAARRVLMEFDNTVLGVRELVVPAVAAAQPQKPWARMPHSRKASNSPLKNSGRSVPDQVSVCSKKLAACCCTMHHAYSMGCSGRCRSYWTGAPSGARWGCRPMACTRGSRGCDRGRSQAARCASIVLCAVYICMPTAAGTPSCRQWC